MNITFLAQFLQREAISGFGLFFDQGVDCPVFFCMDCEVYIAVFVGSHTTDRRASGC